MSQFPHQTLHFEKKVKIDGSRFIMSGHSLGGCTALQVAESDPRVEAVLTLDPWLMPIKDAVEK